MYELVNNLSALRLKSRTKLLPPQDVCNMRNFINWLKNQLDYSLVGVGVFVLCLVLIVTVGALNYHRRSPGFAGEAVTV